jgi:hypothetical protein
MENNNEFVWTDELVVRFTDFLNEKNTYAGTVEIKEFKQHISEQEKKEQSDINKAKTLLESKGYLVKDRKVLLVGSYTGEYYSSKRT